MQDQRSMSCIVRIAVAALTLGFLTSVVSAQATWYVDDDACPGPGLGTIGDPFCSIQDAIDNAAIGDTVLVSPGTYNESLVITKALRLASTDGPDVTTIDATGLADRVVFLQNVLFTSFKEGVHGFTITGGNALQGGGIFVTSWAVSITGCVFENNTADEGGAIYINSVFTTRVANCVFQNNHANVAGGAIYVKNSKGPFTHCRFEQNTSDGTGGALQYENASLEMYNSVLHDNDAITAGGAIQGNASVTSFIVNCTLNQNSASAGPTLQITGGIIRFHNSIIWNSTNPINIIAGSVFGGNSNIQGGGFGGLGNIDANPMFVNAAVGDLHLLSGSPCIDAGDSLIATTGFDLDGNLRMDDDPSRPDTGDPIGGVVIDMGAFEVQGPVACAADINGDTTSTSPTCWPFSQRGECVHSVSRVRQYARNKSPC